VKYDFVVTGCPAFACRVFLVLLSLCLALMAGPMFEDVGKVRGMQVVSQRCKKYRTSITVTRTRNGGSGPSRFFFFLFNVPFGSSNKVTPILAFVMLGRGMERGSGQSDQAQGTRYGQLVQRTLAGGRTLKRAWPYRDARF
jgi:hypothetical protein